MINSSVSGVSGFNANAYTTLVARAKQKTGEVSKQENELRPEDYWTPERMRQAIPPDMGRVAPEPEPKPHIPEHIESPQETKPGFVSGSVPQLNGYWTPERMRQAIPPDMGRVAPEPEPKPHIPEQREPPEETKPDFVSGSVPQLNGYWTPERMRQAIPPDMGRVAPELEPKPHIPEQRERPEETKPGFVSGSVPQLDGYWTPERMREAVPPEMGRAVPGSDVKPHIPEHSESPQETYLPADAKGFLADGESGSWPQPNPKPINTIA